MNGKALSVLFAISAAVAVACSGNDSGLFRAAGAGGGAAEANREGGESSVDQAAGGVSSDAGGVDVDAEDAAYDTDASPDADASPDVTAGAGGAVAAGGAAGAPAEGGAAGTSASGGRAGSAGSGAGGAGAGGAAGGAAGSGNGCAKDCDCDGDGYLAAGAACGGDDCDDHNDQVHPGQTAYFYVPTETGSFDYDCSNRVEREYGSTLTCLPVLCPSGEGYFGSPPACGAKAAWGVCTGALCSQQTLEQRREACH